MPICKDSIIENDDVKTGFTTGLYSGDMIYPLITSEKRLYYDSSTASPNYDGNLYHDTSSPDADRGLAYTDLKPAIKVPKVLEAIESKYNISFTGFFKHYNTHYSFVKFILVAIS